MENFILEKYLQGVDHWFGLGDEGQGVQAPVAAVCQGPVTQTRPQTLGQVVVTQAPVVSGEAPGVQMLPPAVNVRTDQGDQGGQEEAEGDNWLHYHVSGQWGRSWQYQTMITIT